MATLKAIAALTRQATFAYMPAFPRGAGVSRPFPVLKVTTMSRRCELTGVGPMVGHNVSHSNIKTKRRFLPALKATRLQSEALGQTFNLRITNAALRTLDFRGGLDIYLVKTSDELLSPRALKIKKQVKAKLASQPAA
jgi:large subunit ribosomal protein L28